MQEIAGPIEAADRRAEERELNGLAEREFEFGLIEDNLVTFFEPLRDDAEEIEVPRLAGFAADGEVIRPGDAAADAFTAAVFEVREMGGSPGDGPVERRIRQHQWLPGLAGLIEPV